MPNALLVVAVTRTEVVGAMQPIQRVPLMFGRLQWIDPDSIDQTFKDLLPPKTLAVSKYELEFMRRAFEEGSIEGISWHRPGS